MVSVEGALGDSLSLYKRNPIFIIPHLVESILTFAVLLSVAVTIILAIGVHVADVALSDPQLLVSQIEGAGLGLLAVIILTILFGVFLISLIKAGALAGVVGMAQRGFKGEKVSWSVAIENAKKHALNIFLFWIVAGLILVFLFVGIFIPAFFAAVIGLSESLAVALAFLALFVALILALAFYVSIMFTPQYIVVGSTGIVGSMKESVDFVRRNIGAVLIYIVVVVVFSFFFFSFFGILSLVSDLFSRSSRFLGASLEIFLNLLSIVVSLVVAPYFEMVKTKMITEQENK
ncbi:MAG: hypothetical protein ACE5HH_03420 [Candidatus Hydrothermarchaeales archaeon]